MIDEVAGEPVEEFGVAGWLSLAAEVFRGADQAFSEKDLPVAVHGDATGQRMLGVGEPVGEAEAIVGLILGERRKSGGRASGDLLATRIVNAAFKEVGGAGFLHLLHDHDLG